MLKQNVSCCFYVRSYSLLFLLQFLKQMYVLVLGLDVLGNPFGLIRGLSEGVEAFFYEPFQVQQGANCSPAILTANK